MNPHDKPKQENPTASRRTERGCEARGGGGYLAVGGKSIPPPAHDWSMREQALVDGGLVAGGQKGRQHHKLAGVGQLKRQALCTPAHQSDQASRKLRRKRLRKPQKSQNPQKSKNPQKSQSQASQESQKSPSKNVKNLKICSR